MKTVSAERGSRQSVMPNAGTAPFIRNLTKVSTVVYVVTGPLFLPQEAEDGTRWVKYQVIGDGNVAVPIHFFKLIYLESTRESLAFILPNKAIDRDVPLENFRTTVKKVEQVAGIIFNHISGSNPAVH